MDANIIKAIRDHAAEVYPNECCGFIVESKERVLSLFRCVNQYPDIPLTEISPINPVKTSRIDFLIDPLDEISAQKLGKIVAVYHSHPDGRAEMSPLDIVASEETGYPYFVTEYPGPGWTSYVPKKFSVELIGRPFIYGVYDCFTLVRDYLRLTHGYTMPPAGYLNYGWWMAQENHSFYLEGFKAMGFQVVNDLKPGTVILMRYRTRVPNHVAVYTGDGFIMHHLSDRCSELAPYGGQWEHTTVALLHHPQIS